MVLSPHAGTYSRIGFSPYWPNLLVTTIVPILNPELRKKFLKILEINVILARDIKYFRIWR